MEKTPFNERFTFLTEYYFRQKARYVHILRDPRAVVASMLPNGINERERAESILAVCCTWARSVRDGLWNVRAFGDRYHVLRYEDLVLSPRGVMQEVQRFLGIEPHETLSQATRLGSASRVNSSYPDDVRTTTSVVATQVDRYKSKLSRAEIEFIETMLEMPMRACGYGLDVLHGDSSTRQRAVQSGSNSTLRKKLWTVELNRIRRLFADVQQPFGSFDKLSTTVQRHNDN